MKKPYIYHIKSLNLRLTFHKKYLLAELLWGENQENDDESDIEESHVIKYPYLRQLLATTTYRKNAVGFYNMVMERNGTLFIGCKGLTPRMVATIKKHIPRSKPRRKKAAVYSIYDEPHNESLRCIFHPKELRVERWQNGKPFDNLTNTLPYGTVRRILNLKGRKQVNFGETVGHYAYIDDNKQLRIGCKTFTPTMIAKIRSLIPKGQ